MNVCYLVLDIPGSLFSTTQTFKITRKIAFKFGFNPPELALQSINTLQRHALILNADFCTLFSLPTITKTKATVYVPIIEA